MLPRSRPLMPIAPQNKPNPPALGLLICLVHGPGRLHTYYFSEDP